MAKPPRPQHRQFGHERGGRDRHAEREPFGAAASRPERVDEALSPPGEGERKQQQRGHQRNDVRGGKACAREPDAQQGQEGRAQDERSRGTRGAEAAQEIRAEAAHDDAAGQERDEHQSGGEQQRPGRAHEPTLASAGGTTTSGSCGLDSGVSRTNRKS